MREIYVPHLVKDCPLCDCGLKDVGYKFSRGHAIVYKTGNDPRVDWYAVLQPNTRAVNSEDAMFTIQAMPLGHIESLDVKLSDEFGQRMGIMALKIRNSLGFVAKDIFPNKKSYPYTKFSQVDCESNSLPHLHEKYIMGLDTQNPCNSQGNDTKKVFSGNHPNEFILMDSSDTLRGNTVFCLYDDVRQFDLDDKLFLRIMHALIEEMKY